MPADLESGGEVPITDMAVAGRLTGISGRVLEGWALPDAGAVEIYENQTRLGSVLATELPPDGQTDEPARRRYFSFLLPQRLFGGGSRLISARAASGAEFAGSPMPLGEVTPAASDIIVPAGSFDMVSDEGWVLGWAWYPAAPAERVEVEFLIDGEIAGVTLAASHRADVAAAGVGDGNYGFSWALPYEVMLRPRDSLIVARDRKTGFYIPEPRVFRQRVVADALVRVGALEAELKQLHGTLALLSARHRGEERAAAELFKTVGDFFSQLAAATIAGDAPGSLMTLQTAVAEAAAKYRPVHFAAYAAPAVSICVAAQSTLDSMVRQFAALSESAGDLPLEIMLLDRGDNAEAPLLPLIVRNLRYTRLPGLEKIAAANEIARLATGDILVFLNEFATPRDGWLDAAAAAFATRTNLFALAAKSVAAGGTLGHAGVTLQDGAPAWRGGGADPADPAFNAAAPVDAVAPAAFAVRREVWNALNGLDETYATLGVALAELCHRARAAGHEIIYDPGFALRQAETKPEGMTPESREDAARMQAQA